MFVSTGPANEQSDSHGMPKHLEMALSPAHSVKPSNPTLSLYVDLKEKEDFMEEGM